MLPSNVSFGTVVGRFMRAVADGADGDRDPDGQPLVGLQVKFTPSVKMFKNVADTSPVTIFADPIVATTDADGVLVDSEGAAGVHLLATDDPDLQPSGWTWEVSISSSSIAAFKFSFALPSGGQIDLTSVIPVASSPGTTLPGVSSVAGLHGDVLASDLAMQLDPYMTGGSGSTSWGGITGTLSEQTDLNAALDEKVNAATAPELIRDTMGTALVAGANVTITPSDAGDTITIAASGGSSLTPVRVQGRWHGPLIDGGASDGTVMGDGALWCIPSWSAGESYDAIWHRLTITDAAATLRLGLYTVNPTTGLPGALIYDSGPLSGSVSGNRIVPIAPALQIAGPYFACAVINSATAKAYAVKGGQLDRNWIGATNPDNAPAVALRIDGYSSTSPLPATAVTTGVTYIAPGSAVAVTLRRA